MRKLVLILCSLLFLTCGPEKPQAALPSPVPAPKVKPEVAGLVRHMPNEDEFAPNDVDKAENLPLFIELAATAQDESLRVAALRAMRHAYPAHAVDAYTRAVAHNLKSREPRVLDAALEASSPSLGREASPEVRQELLRLVRSRDKAVRLATLDTLWQAEPFPTPVFLGALDDPDTAVRGMALLHLVQQKVRDTGLYPRALELMRDSDPGIRGKAIELALLSGGSPVDRLTVMLSDDHPYVRSQAALGLGRLGQFTSVPRLMPLLMDRAASLYELEYTNLAGDLDRLYFEEHADDAALTALSHLSHGRYLYREALTEEDRLREVQRAREWYRRAYRLD